MKSDRGKDGVPLPNEESAGKVPGAKALFPQLLEEFELLDRLEAPAALMLVVGIHTDLLRAAIVIVGRKDG